MLFLAPKIVPHIKSYIWEVNNNLNTVASCSSMNKVSNINIEAQGPVPSFVLEIRGQSSQFQSSNLGTTHL